MEALLNFFALRPVFTFVGLRLVWYVYLTHVIIQLYVSLSTVATILAQRGISFEAWAPNSLPLVIDLIAQVGLVRLLLEVAATVLLASNRNDRSNPI
jgi:hypothetical protein